MNSLYELGNKNDTFLQLYSWNKFTVCFESLINILEMMAIKKSFREITSVQFLSGG